MLRRLHQLPNAWFASLAGFTVFGPWSMGLWLGGTWMIAAFAWAAVLAVFAGWVTQQRIRWRTLPLTVVPLAASGPLDGIPAYRFRICLGDGRTANTAQEKVIFHPINAPPFALPILAHTGPRMGPWTVVAFDPEHRISTGAFHVEVEVEESGKRWTVSARVQEVRPGRFSPLTSPKWAELEA